MTAIDFVFVLTTMNMEGGKLQHTSPGKNQQGNDNIIATRSKVVLEIGDETETSREENGGRLGEANDDFHHRVNILSGIGVVFLVAFWPYYESFPGLISSSGVEPVGRLMPFSSPFLYRTLIATRHVDAVSLCELFAVLGIILSCIVAIGWIQHGLLVVIMTGLYSVLTRVGGTFYSFQWDTLLLEVGSLTALCYAPWKQLRPTEPCPLGAWVLRFLLFKLMYMSGVVKIQADCPTWKHLTALEYHFATQCLPGPLAWHFHQLHPFLLRFSVAATLWIEIPGAFLLLLTPFPTIARIGVALQILLQVFIILSGNYNFFNLLTIILSLACLESHILNQSRKRGRLGPMSLQSREKRAMYCCRLTYHREFVHSSYRLQPNESLPGYSSFSLSLECLLFAWYRYKNGGEVSTFLSSCPRKIATHFPRLFSRMSLFHVLRL